MGNNISYMGIHTVGQERLTYTQLRAIRRANRGYTPHPNWLVWVIPIGGVVLWVIIGFWMIRAFQDPLRKYANKEIIDQYEGELRASIQGQTDHQLLEVVRNSGRNKVEDK